ncbi:CRTAC1 family protein [Bremerella cremea]|uniref:CRTAC1 family protein n=1 Tax=Bremerella cremea TaxID=1031537 RepID=A0A368KY24_9BACT|nr:CRTAC1 family protein [Bremerella cremea]RCS54052.1 CRTAC1 family protein [Bremerella cremea]
MRQILLLFLLAMVISGCHARYDATPAEANVDQQSEPALSNSETASLAGDDYSPVNITPTPTGKAEFVDVTEASGIDFIHTDGKGGSRYIVQTVVAGLATFDFDGDGLVDIYFLNSAPNPGSRFDSPPRNALYRNNGDWTFTDVTDSAGVGDTGYGLGVVTGDYDNDGDQDIYINNFGPNVFYRNNGDGTFTDVTAETGTQCNKVGAGVAMLDIEGDGDLDLYVGNYVDFTYENNIVDKIGDLEFSTGPKSYNPVPDVLFRNNGDGTFTDISRESGIGLVAGPSMGIVASDYDDDGDVDVFVCGDYAANFLFQNDGSGHFKEVALLAGTAYDSSGNANGSMGVDVGDFNRDGKFDFYMTTFSGEMSTLYQNMGDGMFQDMSKPSGSGSSTLPHVKWGTTFADFDNDTDEDIFVACGHFWVNARNVDDRTAVRVPNAYLENNGSGRFTDVSSRSGSAMAILESSKGAAFDDLDNDGDIDAVILNANAAPTLIRNELKSPANSVQIALLGRESNRDGVGAKIVLETSAGEQQAEMRRGRGYQSSYGNRVHFGLGDATLQRIRVRWPSGKEDVIEDPPAAKFLLIREGGECLALKQGLAPPADPKD